MFHSCNVPMYTKRKKNNKKQQKVTQITENKHRICTYRIQKKNHRFFW